MNRFFRSVALFATNTYGELRRVQWPSFPQVGRYFVSIVLGAAIGTAFIWVVDFGFLKLLELAIR